jgi:wobble nucleotide-excising tRNase
VIEEISNLKGTGMLHDSVANGPLTLSQAVAVYAENGRGKSTFSCLLGSLTGADYEEVRARRSLRETVEPSAELQINGVKHTFSQGSWDTTYDGVRVFDDTFVEKNVCLGRLIGSRHLEHLFQFAVGKEAAQPADHIADVLDDFRDGVNARLRTFGADFEIAGLERSGTAEAPRAHFSLRLMGSEVPLVAAESTAPSFSTTLSPGDRRLLALAFFFSDLDGDPNLLGGTVVLDDPARGFDKRRKTRVVEAIIGFIGRAQLVVLSHDADFIQMLRDGGFDQVLELRRSGAFCVFEECDIDAVCAMDYADHYEEPENYQSGGHPM